MQTLLLNEWWPRVVEWVHRPVAPPRLSKEIRILLPAWIVAWVVPCALLILCWNLELPDEWSTFLAASAFALAASVLGASGFGHEFTWHTLPLFLAQPASREKLWWVKMSVLVGALIGSALPVLLCAFWLQRLQAEMYQREWLASGETQFLVLAVVGAAINAACLGSWLSLLTRNALAGAVFSLALPAFLGFLERFLQPAPPNPDNIFLFWKTGLLVLWAVGLLLGRRQFLLLKAVETPAADLSWPSWINRSHSRELNLDQSPRFGRWFWNVARKELRLQQVIVVLAVLLAASFVLFGLLARRQPELVQEWTFAVVLLYSTVIALLTGALSCAEERQLGTLEWSLTLPIRPATQWAIKAGVALGLSVLLGALLPVLLMRLPALGTLHQSGPDGISLVAWVVLVTGWSIYASSLSLTTIRAALLGLVLVIGCQIALVSSVFLIARTALSGVLVVILLWLAFGNFRRAGPRAGRVLKQAVAAAVCVCVTYAIALAL